MYLKKLHVELRIYKQTDDKLFTKNLGKRVNFRFVFENLTLW